MLKLNMLSYLMHIIWGFNGSKDGSPNSKMKRNWDKFIKKRRRMAFPKFERSLKEYNQYKGAGKLKAIVNS